MPLEATATPDAPQTTPESPSPAIETPAPATEPAAPSQETSSPEAPSAPAEEAPAPETDHPSSPTGQLGGNDPLPPEPDPIQPPSAAAPVPTGILHAARDLLLKARVTMQDRKRKKRDKILQALKTKNKITNDEVEKLLHVSDATAARYLSALVKENKIRQVGKTGTGVAYTKI